MNSISKTEPSPQWSSRFGFLLATIGFSVGLGNIWRFPYLAGENGGGAFVLIYIVCVFAIGIPIVMAEMVIGKRGGSTPARSFKTIAMKDGLNSQWSLVGHLAVITGFLIIAAYCVVGGWTLHYIYLSVSGELADIENTASATIFQQLLAKPSLLIFWNTVFILLNAGVVIRGVNSGIEKAAKILMPALFILLVGLAGYGLVVGDMEQSLAFLFKPDFSKVTGFTVINAVGQAFFSVGVGMAALLTYSAYLPKGINIAKSATIICISDTIVALLAGLAIFPFVFLFDFSPSEGPGLVFITMPTVLGGFGGGLLTLAFFTLLAVAALTSSIGGFEVFVAIGRNQGISRPKSIGISAALCWVLGLTTIISFNVAADFYPLAFIPGFETATFFDAFNIIASTIGLPIGAALMAIFVGWFMSRQASAKILGFTTEHRVFRVWRFLAKWLLPFAILAILATGLRS
ncbi:sodium-dependent transporter [Kordiimonas pumila]|uniref:Transporter n=1 Tax=Kordiimonas pumila TaxID=2161677 RepID=A0ABV7D4Q1_9PROT|nr:sodium-dependent transporter [Kordiimonas pumila]